MLAFELVFFYHIIRTCIKQFSSSSSCCSKNLCLDTNLSQLFNNLLYYFSIGKYAFLNILVHFRCDVFSITSSDFFLKSRNKRLTLCYMNLSQVPLEKLPLLR